MKICINANLYYNVGAAETVYQYYKECQRLGIELAISGFIEHKVAQVIPTIGPAEPLKSDESNPNGRDYFITSEMVKDVDLFIFYFDSFNPYDPRFNLEGLERLTSVVPRNKSIVIDADGKYSKIVHCEGDFNHKDEEDRKNWRHTFESLSDKIFQPTCHITETNARSFVFWGYKEPEITKDKKFDLLYVGTNWYRLDRLKRFLIPFLAARELFPRIGVIGGHWKSIDPYTPQATKHDLSFFENNGIELEEYITGFGELTQILSSSRYSPILIRPVLSKMKMLTPRMLETFASGTIALLPSYFDYAESLYGDASCELRFDEGNATQKVMDLHNMQEHFKRIAISIQDHLRKEHSYKRRIEELMNMGGL